MRLQLNCDLAELDNGVEQLVMPHIDMANVACALHAGNIDLIQSTIALAKHHQVSVGAHPSYNDPENFGRQSVALNPQQLQSLLLYQIGALKAMTHAQGVSLKYVKPHGALYNDMMADRELLTTILKVVGSLKNPIKLMLLATADNHQYQELAQQYGVELIFEAFADRLYTDQGTLTSRSIAGAVLTKEQSLAQVELLVKEGKVITGSGKSLALHADSICVHGDNEQSIAMIQAIEHLCKSS